jgi:PAS domain S-box-containing protein
MSGKVQSASDARYFTFLSLSGDGIARFELDPPISMGASEDEQLDLLLRNARVVECNELFAGLYGRVERDMIGLAMGAFVPRDDPSRLTGVREFIRSGYRLLYSEEEHALGGGATRWLGASAFGTMQDGKLLEYWICIRDLTARKRLELERERRGRILEAVAFTAARLLQPGSWREHFDRVVARLGEATQNARIFLGEAREDPERGSLVDFRFVWNAPGIRAPEDPDILRGVSLEQVGLGRIETEVRAGRPFACLVRELSEAEQQLPRRVGSKAFAVVPIFADGGFWGFLAFGETRHEREWSAPELEGLKAAAAVLGAAIERERADGALRESEERFARLSAASFEGIAVTESGVFVDGNEQLAQMLGLPLERLIGRSVSEFIAPEDLERVRAKIAKGSEGPYQHLAIRPDGTKFPVEVSARSLPYRDRSVRVTALRDVSERTRAEELQQRLEADLRHAAEEWRQTFDALDLGIVLADADGRIVRLNRGALDAATQSSFGDAAGTKLEALARREPWRMLLDLHKRVGETLTSRVAQALEPESGRAFYLLASPWFREPGEPPWRVLTFRDVTELMRLQEQLRQSRVMEAMGSLVAGVAHEVRNPLFSISATVDAIEAIYGVQPELKDHITLLRAQVGRLTQLTRDLLDYGRPQALQRVPTDVAEVVRRATRACATLLSERRVTVREQLKPGLPRLDVDGARIEQALENLIANAIQHSPEGGVVTVRGELETGDGERFVRCAVEDQGRGLADEDLARVFEPFFTRRRGGTGLGLPIVRRIISAHGGRAYAGNLRGGGACFTLWLPVHGHEARGEGSVE